MPDNNDTNNGTNNEQKNKIILNIPAVDNTANTFSFRDLVLTVYNARKTFLVWVCIGAFLGTVAAAGMYLSQRNSAPSASETGASEISDSSVSVTMILNYSAPSEHIFPDGEDFNESSFYNTELWNNALIKIGRDDIPAADAMSQVSISNISYRNTIEELANFIETLPPSVPANMYPTILQGLLANGFSNDTYGNTYLFTIPADKTLLSNSEKADFLQALCTEYESYILSTYYNDAMAGMLNGQLLSEWLDLTAEDISWDLFDYNVNFRLINGRYRAIAELLQKLYTDNPLYISAGGKRFDEYAGQIDSIVNTDIKRWITQTEKSVYIRDADRFLSEYDTAIGMKRASHQYYVDLLASYNESLYAYRQSPADAAGHRESFGLFLQTQELAEIVADLHRQIIRMEVFYEALTEVEGSVRAGSREAETALNDFITELDSFQEELHSVITDYYRQRMESDKQEAVLVTEPDIMTASQPASGSIGSRNLIMIAFAFMVCIAACVVMAFLIVAVKKHLPAKEQPKDN